MWFIENLQVPELRSNEILLRPRLASRLVTCCIALAHGIAPSWPLVADDLQDGQFWLRCSSRRQGTSSQCYCLMGGRACWLGTLASHPPLLSCVVTAPPPPWQRKRVGGEHDLPFFSTSIDLLVGRKHRPQRETKAVQTHKRGCAIPVLSPGPLSPSPGVSA